MSAIYLWKTLMEMAGPCDRNCGETLLLVDQGHETSSLNDMTH